jgi:nitrogen regulatory protein P-II 1
MRKIEAIIREEKLHEVIDALHAADLRGITAYQVMGSGTQRGSTGVVRGQKVYTQILPKIKLEIVVSSAEWEEKAIRAITEHARTGEFGDGKIFVYDMDTAIRIRTGERDADAIRNSEL